jgi:hypothetical protein
MPMLSSLVTNPGLLLRHRNIFLLSHMRANTSLFGHLLGSHPLVEGYYELHIGYHGWKSLWRQKMLHFAEHDAKPGARWMFDKVLHDGHAVAPAILQRPSCRTILMLRAPAQTLPSLVALYRRELPHLPEATTLGAARYYVDRLATLSAQAAQIGPAYFYLDAECLVGDTDHTLHALGAWLGFGTPIPRRYQPFVRTGRGGAGDTSERLRSGEVQRGGQRYDEITFEPALMAEADAAWQRCRSALVAGSAARVTQAETSTAP